jgi:hypothetical protein
MRPEHVLGEAVPLNVLLARTPKAAVKVQHITAFPTGFEFQLVAHCRIEGELWDPMHGLAGFRGRPHGRGSPTDDEILRFGIQFSDGSKVTSLGPPMIGPTDKAQKGPMLMHSGGSSGGSVAEQTFWVWPLPPPGPLTFVCEWPKYGIRETRYEIDANLIREAAKRATELWPDQDSSGGGGTTSGSISSYRAD